MDLLCTVVPRERGEISMFLDSHEYSIRLGVSSKERTRGKGGETGVFPFLGFLNAVVEDIQQSPNRWWSQFFP